MKKRFFKIQRFVSISMLILIFPAVTAAQELSQDLSSALLKAEAGQLVPLPGYISQEFPNIAYDKMVLPSPQYIISDDPEYIRIPEAIAMKEKVAPGAVRLYIYNVNGVEEPKIDRMITAIIENQGDQPMHLRMLKYSSQAPTTNYYKAGKEGLADYFASKGKEKVIVIQPGEAAPIDQKLEGQIVKYNELVHGFYDFVIDQPGEVSIIQTSPTTPGPEALKTIDNVLPPSSHSGAGRGMFGISNYSIKNKTIKDTKDGPFQLIVADGQNDPWVRGVESLTGNNAELAGNYGVLYHTEITWKSSDGRALALVTWNPRSANRWCKGLAASIVIKTADSEKIVQIPSNQLVIRAAPEAAVIYVFPPASDGEQQTIEFTYSPPGASCLPMPLVFIPVEIE